MSYADWKVRLLTVDNLKLDAQNARFQAEEISGTQTEVIKELVQLEKVYDVAKSITNIGYLSDDRPIVIKDNDNFIVLEGNRRVCALQVLRNPNRIKNSRIRNRFIKLKSSSKYNIPDKIYVRIAPSRNDADTFLILKHESNLQRPWQPFMKAKFVHMMIQRGKTVDDIVNTEQFKKSEVYKLLRAYAFYTEAISLDLPEDILKKVRDPQHFSITNLIRVCENQHTKKALGIAFREGNIIGYVDRNEFYKGFKRIVTDIALDDDKDSRYFNKSDDIKDYISDELGIDKPNLNIEGEFIIDTTDPNSKLKTSEETRNIPKVRPPKTKRRQTNVISSDLPCYINSKRINKLYKELSKLKIDGNEQIASFSIRIFLESLLGNYLYETNNLTPLLKKINSTRKPHYHLSHPPLLEMFSYTINESNLLDDDEQLRESMQIFMKTEDDFLSYKTLNYYIHNKYALATVNEVLSLLGKLDPLLRKLLTFES